MYRYPFTAPQWTPERVVNDIIPGYLSWDIPDHPELILRREIRPVRAIVLDQVHKYRLWRQLVKGFYDQHGERLQILVTGSAHLEAYCRGGDSLQGRYHMHRLPPLSVAEPKREPRFGDTVDRRRSPGTTCPRERSRSR